MPNFSQINYSVLNYDLVISEDYPPVSKLEEVKERFENTVTVEMVIWYRSGRQVSVNQSSADDLDENVPDFMVKGQSYKGFRNKLYFDV